MYKIGILFQDREFEHDIYELIRAFYPGSEICSFYEEEEAGCDLYFRIEKQGDSCVIRYEDHENKGVTSAEFIEGQSSDALISCVDADDSEAKERAHAIRKERKDIVKIALYKLLVKLTGKTLPWGNLTGIRPAKLAMGLIESGMKNTEAAQEMRERYMVSPQKTALAITIANREREILKDIDYENGYSLYVGIPFCPSICLYCSFSSYPLKQWKNRVNQYLEAHGGKPCEEFRIKKQGDFDWFGKTLGIVSIPRATDRLYTAATRFGQYPIHKEYVLKTIGVMHEIVRENPGEPDHPPYRLLTEEFFDATFTEVIELTEAGFAARVAASDVPAVPLIASC